MTVLDGQATLVDTGGLFGEHVLASELTGQTQLAVDEADFGFAAARWSGRCDRS